MRGGERQLDIEDKLRQRHVSMPIITGARGRDSGETGRRCGLQMTFLSHVVVRSIQLARTS
jgi:hypothetical protein